MKQVVTTGIVLTRTNFGEADRIITVLTPDQGKVRLLAKGVRRPTSKLAGGIELFSVSNITYLLGSGEIKKLVSSRLIEHYGQIVKNIERTMFGYELLKMLNRATEEAPGEEYFDLLKHTLQALNDLGLELELIELWFYTQLLKLAGHTPNLRTDAANKPFDPSGRYIFDFEHMAFTPQAGGRYSAHHIKFLRLSFSLTEPKVLQQVQGLDRLLADSLKLIKPMLKEHVRI
jgi:DNA repair protein RecO